jgi:sugar phosphate isomerase/epimerase
MKIALTTLGCPGWDLDAICRHGSADGYDGVDFRGYLDTMDITTLPQFTSGAAATRRRIESAGLAVCGVSSSIHICKPEDRKANVEEARRTIETANGLGASLVRVFGGGDIGKHSREELVKIGCETVEEILTLRGANSISWLFETHDLWIKSVECAPLLERISNPAFGALWDIGHTTRVGGETPEETYAAIGSRVKYCHLKDALYDPKHAQAMEDGWRYVSAGTGQLPLAASLALLRSHGYEGWLLFEHEKRWHPDLPEPETAFPAFVKWIRPLL